MINELVEPKNGTRFVFFSGKGGVGKTTIAAATAVWLAERGYKTLIVSTDLQKSLNDIFQQDIKSEPTLIMGIEKLRAVSIETAESIERHRGKMVKFLKVVDPNSQLIKQIEADKQTECGCAQAAVFEFVQYLHTKDYEIVVFDTAPTGQTLEKIMSQTKYIMSLIAQIDAKKKLIKVFGEKVKKQIEILEEIKEEEELAIKNLQSDKTSFMMVMIPEAMALAELTRNIPVLEEDYKIPVRGIVINEIIPKEQRGCTEFWDSRWKMQKKYIHKTHKEFSGKVIVEVPLLPTEVLGIDRLREVGSTLLNKSYLKTYSEI